MGFWHEVLASFLASIFAGIFLALIYVLIQWFLRATDVTISYSWRFKGDPSQPYDMRPCFDIRNRSGSRTYFIANVAYLKNKKPVANFDESLWDKELKPGTITLRLESAPIRAFQTLAECFDAEVHVRLQNGRQVWLKATGPGQMKMGKGQRIAFWLRDRIEARAFPME
jgi:hypothetical protein